MEKTDNLNNKNTSFIKRFGFLIFIIIGLLMVVFNIFFIANIINKNGKNFSFVSTKNQAWKTYSSKNGYSIRYPTNWKINLDGLSKNTIEFTSPTQYGMEEIVKIRFIEDYKINLTNNWEIEQYLANKAIFTDFKKVKVGDLDAYKANQKGDIDFSIFYFIRDKDLFFVTSNQNFSPIGNQILSTIKFTK